MEWCAAVIIICTDDISEGRVRTGFGCNIAINDTGRLASYMYEFCFFTGGEVWKTTIINWRGVDNDGRDDLYQFNLLPPVKPGFTVVDDVLSIGAYSVSLAPLTWLIMAEIFPNRIRGIAMSIASVVLWVSNQ